MHRATARSADGSSAWLPSWSAPPSSGKVGRVVEGSVGGFCVLCWLGAGFYHSTRGDRVNGPRVQNCGVDVALVSAETQVAVEAWRPSPRQGLDCLWIGPPDWKAAQASLLCAPSFGRVSPRSLRAHGIRLRSSAPWVAKWRAEAGCGIDGRSRRRVPQREARTRGGPRNAADEPHSIRKLLGLELRDWRVERRRGCDVHWREAGGSFSTPSSR